MRTLWSELLSQLQAPLVRGNFEARGLLNVGAEQNTLSMGRTSIPKSRTPVRGRTGVS